MKQGFTLIELLAVIVILAIIALIATPIVLNIINDTKESATLRSADFYIDALENEIMLENMKTGGSFNPNVCEITNGKVLCDEKEITLKVDGEVPTSGSITFEDGKVTSVNLTYPNGTITLNNKGELVLGESQQGLAPGLYDENDNLIISWADLTSLEYQTITYYFEEYDEETDEYYEVEVVSPILRVDEEGVLTSAVYENNEENFSDEYLVGKLVIDDSVKSIGGKAFAFSTNLTEIVIPDSVTSIGGSAFVWNYNFTSITIPRSVTSIDDYAFWDTGLTTINYTGTEAEWNAISKGEGWDDDTPSSKVINYNYVG